MAAVLPKSYEVAAEPDFQHAAAHLPRTTSIEACLNRSAPVPGRSNVRTVWVLGVIGRWGQVGVCCARGRAHSGGTAKLHLGQGGA